ncbi:MAG: type II secretion system protein GspN [Bradymonadia bacterium]
MKPLLRRVLRYTLYSSFFLVCLILFGLVNLPYEEAEDFMARYARTHLNAELEIDSTSISPLGNVSIDRGSLRFMPTIEEAKVIADAERALAAWNDEQARIKAGASKSKTGTDASESDEGQDPKADDEGDGDDDEDIADGAPKDSKGKATKEISDAERRSKELQALGAKPVVPTAPLPIRFESIVANVSPMALVQDLDDGVLLNERNQMSIQGLINNAQVALNVERRKSSLQVNFTVDNLELGLLSVISRLTEFPVSGALSVDANLSIPSTKDGYDFRDTEGRISLIIQDEAKVGPATVKTKMGNVEFVPITFDKLELDFQVEKRRLNINELRMAGDDLELCGTGYISLNNSRAKPRPKRGRRNANSKASSAKSKRMKSSRSSTQALAGMLTASRSNLFVRFKFKDKYLERKDNSLLRLLVNSRSMKKGKDDAGFIGHKTTATVKSLAGPLSWVPSKTSPHKSAPNQCGSKAAPPKQKSKKSKTTRSTKRSKTPSSKATKARKTGRDAKPFKGSSTPPPRARTTTSSGRRKATKKRSTIKDKEAVRDETIDQDSDEEVEESEISEDEDTSGEAGDGEEADNESPRDLEDGDDTD